MKKISYLFAVVSLTLLLTGCGSSKNVAYFQNSDNVNLDLSRVLYDARIMPKDVLTITVNTTDPEAAAPFNLTVATVQSVSLRTSSTSQAVLQSYIVDNEGNIDFPLIGQVHLGGLTKNEAEKVIMEKIKPYLNASERPIVTVRMINYKISVLGEVQRPGMFTVANEKINILEALAQAGDLTIYGVRDRVKLIREPENKHDKFAVLIKTEKKHKLGYLPRVKNKVIARLLDAGKPIYGIVGKKVEPVRRYQMVWYLKIDVFMDD